MNTETQIQTKKKGAASWKPRESTKVIKEDPNYRYRLVEANEARIATLLEQGWELCSALNGEKAFKGADAEKRIIDGKPLSTVVGERDRVLMRLEKDGAKARDEHFEQKALRQVKGIKSRANQEAGVKTTGEVKINGRVVNEITD